MKNSVWVKKGVEYILDVFTCATLLMPSDSVVNLLTNELRVKLKYVNAGKICREQIELPE
jgi:hypothetical protein